MGVYKLSNAGGLRTARASYKSMLANNLPFLAFINTVVIGGGGGGGSGYSPTPGGGGGAGTYFSNVPGELTQGNVSVSEETFVLNFGTNYSVTVGAGGASAYISADGSASSFHVVNCAGGGRGGGPINSPNLNGAGAGGGGGGTRFSGSGATGGAGTPSSITGTSVTRGGGGGGGANGGFNSAMVGGAGGGGSGRGQDGGGGSNGSVNTGSGGGGAQGCCGSSWNGFSGGSGVVILRYSSAFTITIGAGLTGSTATDGNFKVSTITAGTGNVSWAA